MLPRLPSRVRRAVLLGFLAAARASRAAGGDLPDAVVTLEASTPYGAGQAWNAAPLRFALLADGQVFVGGSARLAAGRLEKAEAKAIEKDLQAVRKLALPGSVSFGAGEERFRLRTGTDKPLDLVATGAPAGASAALRPLAAFLERLLAFDHPSLRPYEPAHYAVTAREHAGAGGCRPWTLPVTPGDVTTGVRTVPADAAAGWTAGVQPTAACAGARRYLVMLRPLVPGETATP
jgi:hypothetical protein